MLQPQQFADINSLTFSAMAKLSGEFLEFCMLNLTDGTCIGKGEVIQL